MDLDQWPSLRESLALPRPDTGPISAMDVVPPSMMTPSMMTPSMMTPSMMTPSMMTVPVTAISTISTTTSTTISAGDFHIATDIRTLHNEAVGMTSTARSSELARLEMERMEMGGRIREEQERLFGRIMSVVSHAVRDAAARGQHSASVLDFGGSDKFGEFCFLYLVRGAPTGVDKREMDAMGVKPLMHRLKRCLRPFVVRHVWTRATNDNTVILYW